MNGSKPVVGIVMGSDSDLRVMKAAGEMLQELGVVHEMAIVSAHRTPRRMMAYASTAADRGLRVIIAGAGGAAHLPGMVAALTPLPVIGVPINSTALDGFDALLSIVQMPAGVPVATVAIDNGANAGLLAAQIIGTSDTAVRAQIVRFRDAQEKKVLDKARQLDLLGTSDWDSSQGR